MSWSFSVSLPVLVLATIVWLISGWLCWANWSRRRTKASALMEGLRFFTVTLIGFTLLRPEWAHRATLKEQPEIVVLNDASGSMQTRDVLAGNNNVLTREEWLNRVGQTNFWRPLEKDAKVVIEDFSRPTTNAPGADNGTDINAALEKVLQRQRHLKAVLLLSDGDWNLGKSPIGAALSLRARNAPVYSVAVGSETPLPDLVLNPVAAPSYGLLGEQISIPFKVQSFLPNEVRTTVSLNSSKGQEGKKEIVIPAFGQVQDAIIWSPRSLGEYPMTLRLPVQSGEALPGNNEQGFRISVRTEKLHVLVVESAPRWEYRYLRNALSRDPGVEMECLLYHPGMSVGQGSNYLSSFPGSKEQLAKYDVVFLGDVGIGDNELSAQDAELLKGLVEQQGSGLVFLPGMRGRQLTLLNTPLKDLVPVIYDDKKSEGVALGNEANLVLTSVGESHFLTMLVNDPERNATIWKNLPGFYWSVAVQKSRPGSEVLAVHSTQRNAAGRIPLLVTRPYGNGETLFMGTDSAWRWRRGVEDKYHYRFWGQVVRWMSHKRHMAQGEGIRLSFSPENPRISEGLYFQATLTDIAGGPQEQLTAKLIAPSGKQERLEFTPVPGGWGVFQGNVLPREAGEYKVSITGQKSGAKLEATVLVGQPQREKMGQPANTAMLREISELSRGRSGSIQDLDKIISQVSLLPETEPMEQYFRLWANPWWGGGILLLLAIYWMARKVAGMI